MKKVLISIGVFILDILKWFVFGNAAIYVATRIINFINDPYMELPNYGGDYKEDLFIMMFQTFGFMIVFGLVVSMYKILFKQNYKWQTLVVFVGSLVITLLGVFL